MIAATANRRALLAKVHIGRKQLGLDDDTWRALVLRVTRVESCGAADDDALGRLVDELERQGFKSKSVPAGPRPEFKKSAKPLARKIWALWGELGRRNKLENPSKQALRAFCARQAKTGSASTDPDFLTPAQANAVIEALKDWVARPGEVGK